MGFMVIACVTVEQLSVHYLLRQSEPPHEILVGDFDPEAMVDLLDMIGLFALLDEHPVPDEPVRVKKHWERKILVADLPIEEPPKLQWILDLDPPLGNSCSE